MLRDVFYYGKKPNVHPREKFAKNLQDARKKATTPDFWIINEFCDYSAFDWEFDFELLPDEDVWAEDHNNVWPSIYQKDSGTWLCSKKASDIIIYRNDVDPLKRKKELSENWKIYKEVDETKFDFGWHPDPTDPPYIYVWGNQWVPGIIESTVEYVVPGAVSKKYMSNAAILKAHDNWVILHDIDKNSFDFSWIPDPREPAYIYVFGNQHYDAKQMPTIEYHCTGATERKYVTDGSFKARLASKSERFTHLENSYLEDYTWVPDPGSPPYIYAFGNQWNKPEDKISVQYVVEGATEYKYMDIRAIRRPDKSNWIIPDNIDVTNFDFSWEPSPKEPAFIYYFPTQWQKTGGPRYVVEGAIEAKYMDSQKVKALPTVDNWTVPKNIDVTGFDFSWHPDDLSPPYIYVFSTQWALTGGPVYSVPGATEKKYIEYPTALALADKTNWDIPKYIDVDGFDFSWHPFSEDDPCIYQIGTQWQKTGGPRYLTPGTDEFSPVKYIDRRIIKSKRLPNKSKFKILYPIIEEEFDWSWHPDSTEEPYIYVFGNQHYSAEKMPTVEYHVEGATQYKYVTDIKARLAPTKDNWDIKIPIVETAWDFTWIPDPGDPPYIYVFGNQWNSAEIESTIEYVVPGASEKKYITDVIAKVLPDMASWKLNYQIYRKEFDFSWRPSPKDPAYIYVFGNNLYSAEVDSTVEYHTPNATQVKYMNTQVARLYPDKTNWEIPKNLDTTNFDFSWHPNPGNPPYIYHFGTQWQRTGGPKYIVKGAKEIAYQDFQKAVAIPDRDNKCWVIPENLDISEFDFSWHPDITDKPYIYQFGTQWAMSGGPKYVVEGATEIKYIENPIAKAAVNMTNWEIPDDIDVDSFDFSWHPYSEDIPYIYQFGTQHQKTGGPRYITPGTDEMSATKYIDTRIIKAKKLPHKDRFETVEGVKVKDFDYSWHPDETDSPYIYVFGNHLYSAEVMPSIRYIVPGATKIKYIHNVKATLDVSKNNWYIPKNIDVKNFDFSWVPNPHDPPYIYEFGTQWQKTDGPQYIVPSASEKKYIEGSLAKKLPDKSKFEIVEGFEVIDFDYSWHPDNTEEPYIYIFGNQHHNAEIMPTVRYVMESATKIKYVNEVKAKIAGKKDNWIIPDNLDTTEFDFSWIPNPYEPPYVYQFGTQWQKTDGPRYVVEGGNDIKYIEGSKAKRLSDKNMFKAYPAMQVASFDFSWHPDSTEQPYIYVFGNEQYDAVTMPTLQYIVPGASEKKYINDVKAKLVANKDNWKELLPIDIERFDFSWLPDPNSPPYIYVFGNQWNSAEKEPTLEYIVPGASEKKYVNDIKAYVKPDKSRFTILRDIEEDKFDFSWRPDPYDDPYIYVFGNQHYSAEKMPTVLYKVKDASERKYINNIKATLAQQYNNFRQIIPVEKSGFDFSWVPDPDEIPYIYVFGNQWNDAEIEPTLEYHSPDAQQIKYMKAKAIVKPDKPRFKQLLDIESFDFSWRPNPKDPPYIYVFGNQWHKAEVEPTLEYIVEGATDKKYVKELVATVSPDMNKWVIPDGVDVSDFDFSWRPDPGAPAYIYQFGTLLDDNDGPLYKTEKNNGETVRLLRVSKKVNTKTEIIPKYYITTNLADLAAEHKTEVFWALRQNIDYSKFDFDWRPNIEQARYVHVFGSPESEMTQTYFISGPMYAEGNKDFNFIQQEAKAESEYLAELFVQQDMFFVDRGNNEAKERFELLKSRYPNIQKTRFLNSWVDTINRCINRSNTELCWILNSELDYTNFAFKYYPNQWQLKMVHVFGTQWSHWGTTFMVNRETFTEDTKYIKIVEHLSNLNFVKDRRAVATNNLYDIVLIDHGNKEITDVQSLLEYKAQGKSVKTVKYDTSYLKTIKNIVDDIAPKKEHYIWICSSVCDYTQFDFSYICDPFAKDNLHVFPSHNQKFGDTFLIDINKTKELINDLQDLRLYNKVNYNQHQKLKRYIPPTIISHGDSHVESVKRDFDYPYAIFVTDDNKDIKVTDTDVMSLWSQDTKEILQTTTGGTRIIVPREAKNHIKTQLYDYPYIKTASKLVDSKPLDIVYLSNGEKDADINYEHLLSITKGLKNRVVRIDGVQGRVAAYHAALKASDTPWAFTVFAKLKVNSKFDWNWQPDRLQMPKHYIFHAKNPVNGLEYGHQGMIAYNKQLVFNNFGDGLDFTLDDPHETIEILSGTANFNTDAYSTWRTAFREVIKLKSDYTDISQDRLKIWLTKAKGKFAKDCLQGANDAVEYYDQVNGDIDKLKLSYEWNWLNEYYNRKYK